jgi:hypothetical protein
MRGARLPPCHTLVTLFVDECVQTKPMDEAPKLYFPPTPPDFLPPPGDDRIAVGGGHGTVRVQVGSKGRSPVDLLEGRRQGYWAVRVPGTQAVGPVVGKLARFVRETVHPTDLQAAVADAVEPDRVLDARMLDHVVVIERVIGEITAPSNPFRA